MTALIAMALLSGEPDPAVDPDDESAAADEAEGVDRDWLEEGTLEEADRQAEWIAAQARRARAARASTSYWPRLTVSLRLGDALAPALDRAAGAPERWRSGHGKDLVWSILATWGAP